MDIVLIPGFWLDGASWDEVAAPLRNVGHTVHALTLPGLESRQADRSGIGLRDHVDAVVAAVDSLPDPVVLVGHSGGGAIAHAAADARPDRIARVVYVDSWPLGHGGVINDELPAVNGEVPLPEWSGFDEGWMADGHPHVSELAKVTDVEFVDLPTGHWPQLTRPRELATTILAAVDR
jgi:pimeloyl-ACP methyl ester carboxylesterase